MHKAHQRSVKFVKTFCGWLALWFHFEYFWFNINLFGWNHYVVTDFNWKGRSRIKMSAFDDKSSMLLKKKILYFARSFCEYLLKWGKKCRRDNNSISCASQCVVPLKVWLFESDGFEFRSTVTTNLVPILPTDLIDSPSTL